MGKASTEHMQTSLKKDVILFNMSAFSDWQNGVVNRNRFVANQLYKDKRIGKILMIDFLPFHSKMMIKYMIKKPNLKKVYEMAFGQLYQYSQNCYVFHTYSNMISEELCLKQIDHLIHLLDMKDFMIWSYNPLFIKPFLHFHRQLLVFDGVDNWMFHESYQKNKKILEENYQIIDEASDYIFTVSKELSRVFRNHKDVYWVPNGVDMEHFQKTYDIPQEIAHLPKPIIGYMGIIQDRMNIDLVAYIAKHHPDKSFVFAGPVWKGVRKDIRRKLSRFKNIHFLGKIPYEASPAYIQSFDACIIPHKINPYIQSQNSMKIYEYMSCQKPVIATPGSGVELFSDIAYITDTYEKFSQAIENAPQYMTQERKEKAGALLEQCTWEKRVKKMLDIIL